MLAPQVRKSGAEAAATAASSRTGVRVRKPVWPWILHAGPVSPLAQGVLQRKCACGALAPKGGSCAECEQKKASPLQRKLAIGASNDPLEHEADRVAAQVMAAPKQGDVAASPPRVQRARSDSPAQEGEAPPSVDRALGSAGLALDGALRRDMEARFGHDFSQVRIHQDAAAEQSARDVGARAYTVGSSIVFAAGQFAPAAPGGRHLLAHELTHVIQQGFAKPARQPEGPAIAPGTRPSPQMKSGVMLSCANGMDGGVPDAGPRDAAPIAGAPEPAPAAPPPAIGPEAPGPAHVEPPPCPLSIQGPTKLDHYCAAYVPSDAASCGTFPAPNITLTASGAAAGAALTWSVTQGGSLASIVGPNNGATVAVKGDGASGAANDVTVQLSNGACSVTHRLTVRQPKSLSIAQAPSSGPSFVENIITYTLKDQFGQTMGAGICLDETITICSRSHPITPTFGDAPTNASGQQTDTLRVSVPSGTLPASFCIKLNQSITGGGCGPLVNNTIVYQPSGVVLTPGASCAAGTACP